MLLYVIKYILYTVGTCLVHRGNERLRMCRYCAQSKSNSPPRTIFNHFVWVTCSWVVCNYRVKFMVRVFKCKAETPRGCFSFHALKKKNTVETERRKYMTYRQVVFFSFAISDDLSHKEQWYDLLIVSRHIWNPTDDLWSLNPMQLLVKVTKLQFISIAELSADLRLNTGHTRMHACTGLQD